MATIHFLEKKSINYQRAMRRMDEIRITVMIIVWWYSDTFLSLPIILFSFYLLAFQCFHAMIICLPVIPWGWLHSFRVSITFHAVFIEIFFTRCAWLTSLCGWLTVIFSHLRDWQVFFQPGNQGSHDFFWCCRVDVDNPYVLAVEIEIEKRKGWKMTAKHTSLLPTRAILHLVTFWI
jgi:hypothetical protein